MSPMVNPISLVASLVGDVDLGRDMAHALHDLLHQLQELMLNVMDRGPVNVPTTTITIGVGMNGHGRAWLTYEICFNCGERSHYAPKCPSLVRERGIMYLIIGRDRG